MEMDNQYIINRFKVFQNVSKYLKTEIVLNGFYICFLKSMKMCKNFYFILILNILIICYHIITLINLEKLF
jgi:hypothetical protein